MIKVNNLNKFYNKNKDNQIHVINDISLEFESTGLVCLLGPSGSGKTTLLNAIGGLDKVDSGYIEYNDERLDKYKSDDWDFIRNKNVGYIFQNYNLLLNLTVYENIMFTLKMTNLSDEDAHQRVLYALKAVGIEKYYKRKVTQLSGGQQQRVAIARALAKSPNVIIADEPTGNLDEKNTTAVMNILKQISKTTLVILVTHEQRIANFYASRIIKLSDGKIISDEVNKNSDVYSYSDDNNIYLKDLNKNTTKDNNININYFYEKDKHDLEFNVIFKNGTFFIEPLNNSKVHVVSSEDEFSVINDHKPTLNLDDIEEVKYDLEKISNDHYSKKSNIKYKDSFKMAFKRILEMKKRQKLVFLGFMLSAFLFVIACSSLYSGVVVNEEDFIKSGYNEYQISSTKKYSDENEAFLKDFFDEEIGLMYVGTFFTIDYNGFVQGNNNGLSFTYYNTSLNLKDNIKDSDLIYGELGDVNSIVVDKMVVDSLLQSASVYKLGFRDYEDFIGLSINNNRYIISGIVDKKTPEIYSSKSVFMSHFNNLFSYVSDKDINMNINKEEVLVSNRNISIGNTISLNNKYYKVVGYQDYADYVFNEDDFFDIYFEYILEKFNTSSNLLFHSYDNDKTDKFIEDSTLLVSHFNYYRNDLEFYKETILYTTIILLGLSAVLVTTSLIFLYFIMRSSLISRVYDIGVYRALGITKKDIRKIFTSEITLISLLSSFIGYIVASSIILNFGAMLGLRLNIFLYLPILVVIIGLNIVIGLKPINSLLNLTPSEIGSKYDI